MRRLVVHLAIAWILSALTPGVAVPEPATPPEPAPVGPWELPAKEKAGLAELNEARRKEHEESVQKALDEFQKMMRETKGPNERAAVLSKLKDTPEYDPRIAAELIRSLGDSEAVRTEAMSALGRYRRDEKSAAALARMLRPSEANPAMLSKALDALASVAHPIAVPAVAPYLHGEPKVAAAAARALGEMGNPAGIEPLIAAWEAKENDVKKGGDPQRVAEERWKIIGDPVRSALALLTWEQLNSAAEARLWWLKNRGKLKPRETPPAAFCRKHLGPAYLPDAALIPGAISHEVWIGNKDRDLAEAVKNNRFAVPPTYTGVLAAFEAPVDFADHYIARIRGYLHPPAGASYTFWIASDDQSELYLSTDETPANKKLIARAKEHADYRQWDKYPEQKSAPIPLQAGRRYYIEAIQHEGSGWDNLSVAWSHFGSAREVILGKCLAPIPVAGGASVVDAPGAVPKTPGPAPPPESGLVAHWPLDGGPEAAVGPAGVVNDSPEWTTGVFGKALRIRDANGWVEIPKSPDVDNIQERCYSISVWFRPDALPQPGPPGDSYFGLVIKPGRHMGMAYNQQGQFQLGLWTGKGAHNVVSREHPAGAFCHAVGTVDLTSGAIHVYVNGQLEGSQQVEGNASSGGFGGTTWRIGIADINNRGYRWAAKGTIDDVRLYNRALAAAEVEALYRAGVFAASSPVAPPKGSKGLVRAVNLNGPAVTIDAIPYEAGPEAANCLAFGRPYEGSPAPLNPAAAGDRARMLQTGMTNREETPAGTAAVVLGRIPKGQYQVYLYVCGIDSSPQRFRVALQKKDVPPDRAIGGAGRWELLGPWPAEVTDGALTLECSGGPVILCGIEVWRR